MRKLLLVFFLAVALCHSQTRTFIREYTYLAEETDSKITSRAIALDQVKRILLEEIGVYLQSEMSTKKEEKNNVYNELTKQQIQSITAGITETIIVEEKWTGEKYYIKASISVDPDEVNKNIARIGADQSKLKELEDVKHKADDAFAEIERLRKELASTKSENDKLTKQNEYKAATNILSVSDWLQKASYADKSKDYDKAIIYYQKAIELDPNNSIAYNNRGCAKHYLQDYQGAIADFNKAIDLNPKLVEAYNSRGYAKYNLQDHQGAIADYNTAIGLKPDYTAYVRRGTAKCFLKDYRGAIADFNKAIDLKPDGEEAYNNRGYAKRFIKDYDGAIADCNKAIDLKQDNVEAYTNRGSANVELGDYEGAIADFTIAIGLEPDYAKAYYKRGTAYLVLDQKSKALVDFMKAKTLGYPVPQTDLDMCK